MSNFGVLVPSEDISTKGGEEITFAKAAETCLSRGAVYRRLEVRKYGDWRPDFNVKVPKASASLATSSESRLTL